MRRITYAAMSTLSALVLLFSYHTSTNSGGEPAAGPDPGSGGSDPVQNAVDFAKFVDGAFGWGVVDPGHGLVFVNASRPMDAVAAAPLSASGSYGPLLLYAWGWQIQTPSADDPLFVAYTGTDAKPAVAGCVLSSVISSAQ